MYDLEHDPGEQKNAYGPDHAADIRLVASWLGEWSKGVRDSVGARLAESCLADINPA